MSKIRIVAIALLLLSFVGCSCGMIMGATPALVPVRLADGTVATPGMGVIAGAWMIIPSVAVALASGVIWFVFAPKQQANIIHDQTTNHLREQMLRLYVAWISALQLDQALHSPGRGEHVQETVRAATIALLQDLDSHRRRVVLQFLYDARLIVGTAVISLHGANLSGVDLRGTDLRGIDLRGADLRGARLEAARLDGANFSGAYLTAAQLTNVKSLDGAIFPEQAYHTERR
jgi:hypothetical protein